MGAEQNPSKDPAGMPVYLILVSITLALPLNVPTDHWYVKNQHDFYCRAAIILHLPDKTTAIVVKTSFGGISNAS